MESLTRSLKVKFSVATKWFIIPSNCVHSAALQDLPRITCPLKIQKKLDYARDKKLKLKEKLLLNEERRRRGSLLISCKRKQYNFYQGQAFNEFDTHKLVSCGWKTNKRLGDYFTIMPHSENPSVDNTDDSCSFHDLGINEKLCEGLKELGITTPTKIQKYAIPTLIKGINAICTAETGSGKTLAYLLPAVEWSLFQKNYLQSSKIDNLGGYDNLNSPNTIILTPNRELTQQVMSVAESLKPFADFVPFLLESSRRRDVTPMDILISTPGLLKHVLKSKKILNMNLQHVVIDESDTLMDDSFIDDVQKIFQMLNVQIVDNIENKQQLLGGTQLVLVSATMPHDIDRVLGDIYPMDTVAKISTQGLHRLQPHVKQTFLRINTGSKGTKIIELLKNSLDKNEPALVFVNNNKTCHYLEKVLQDNGVDCLKLNGEMSAKERRGVFEKFKEGYVNVLVATDIVSRGLDTINVQHVINYDFPTFISDYIHRVGRVGRVGTSSGHVTSFVTHKWDVELVWKIEIAARKMRKLQDVNANIKMKLNENIGKDDVFEMNIIQ